MDQTPDYELLWRKSDVLLQVCNHTINTLADTVAASNKERDALRAENAALKAQLRPKPEATAGA